MENIGQSSRRIKMEKKRTVNANKADNKKKKKSGCISVVIVSAGYSGKNWSI